MDPAVEDFFHFRKAIAKAVPILFCE